MSQAVAGAPRTGHGKVIAASLAAAVGAFLFGFDSSVINGAVDAINSGFGLSAFVKGFAVAIALLGCAAGAWYAGQLADRLGRKKVMLLGAVLFLASSIGSAFVGNIGELMFWRVIGGLGIGLASVISPAYISEIAPARMRGGLTSINQLGITIGIFAALLSDDLVQNSAGGASKATWLGITAWRWMFLVGAVPALVYGVLSFLLPESPRYLVRVGETDGARSVLKTMGDEAPDHKMKAIKESLQNEDRTSFADIAGDRFGLKPLVWVGIVLAALQQLVGINAIFYYSTTLWRSVGFSDSDSFKTSVITAVINVAFTFVALLFVDKVGRRLLLLVGSAGMLVGLALASAAFFNASGSGKNITLPHTWGIVALIGANLFVIFFAATWGPVMWTLLSEMFPNRQRSYAIAICTAANWIFNFIVTVSFPWLSDRVGLGFVYGGFAAFALISYFFVRAMIPETNGTELEDMTGGTFRESTTTPTPTPEPTGR
ncbi:sugar porter family MFS transporter [Allobranchiibius sp. GilTou73]|uniref:sugar porter family MFS transporter n=1 Tax=Allobranchiibius sp. GilTou73 TaxID=2904523 RepID=UPI001F1DAFBB|nr:sugar porter family MFS transporter [Allobranchiibius sp. GilTou73]UIJ35172.1 sugar porter family MFS transporter [Allobranchiibius sp. GilTou73]